MLKTNSVIVVKKSVNISSIVVKKKKIMIKKKNGQDDKIVPESGINVFQFVYKLSFHAVGLLSIRNDFPDDDTKPPQVCLFAVKGNFISAGWFVDPSSDDGRHALGWGPQHRELHFATQLEPADTDDV